MALDWSWQRSLFAQAHIGTCTLCPHSLQGLMIPPSAVKQWSSDTLSSIQESMTSSQPLPVPQNIHHANLSKPPIPHRPSDPNRLAPEDAFYTQSPQRQRYTDQYLSLDGASTSTDGISARHGLSTRRKLGQDRGRSRSRRGKGVWKKLLWVKQKDCMLLFS